MSIRVDIANQVRQTTVLAWRPLLPVFEAIMNSFQAIKEAGSLSPVRGQVTIEVLRQEDLVDLDEPPIRGFAITDNGIGLDKENYDSFNTAFSSHKLSRGGKGLGRFTWLKAFTYAKVESTFLYNDTMRSRSFVFDERYDVNEAIGRAGEAVQLKPGTKVELIGLRPNYHSHCPKSVDIFIQKLIEHFLLVLLDETCPSVLVVDGSYKYVVKEIFERDYKSHASFHKFDVDGRDFTMHGFRISSSRASKHKLVYAADQRSVLSDRLSDYIPNLTAKLEDEEGNSFFYLGIIQSSYLTEHVNTARTDFEFANPEDAELELPLVEEQLIPKIAIRDKALPLVHVDLGSIIASINLSKFEKVRRYVHEEAPQYRILLSKSERFIDKLMPVPSRSEIETVLHRELFLRETELKKTSSRIIREAAKITDYDAYAKEFTEFLNNYNDLGVSALAQYVQHRRIILDFLTRAIKTPAGSVKFPLEKVVHQLVFPMRETSDSIHTSEQNLWIIDERLTYHSFIASDKLNRSISVLDSDDNQRGDIVIFDEKIVFSDERPDQNHPLNSIVVVEFKQPGRNKYASDENPVLQAAKVVNAIRASKYKHQGRAIPVANAAIPAMIFVIADLTPKLRQVLTDFSATETPDKQGFYGYHPNHKVYYEVVDYNKMLSDAVKRNRILFDKLNLDGAR